MELLFDEYETYCEFFQTISAELDFFPHVKVKELPKLFVLIGLVENEEEFKVIQESEAFKKEIKESRFEMNNKEFELNRIYLMEIIVLTIKYVYVETNKYPNIYLALKYVI